jgi:hypothetical protein
MPGLKIFWRIPPNSKMGVGMPDAMLNRHELFSNRCRRHSFYEYDGTQGELIKLRFRPNPDFHARNHESEVFHHMEGSLLVHRRQYRLAELDGRLVTEVKFLDGLLGHLNKGGSFCVKQSNVGGGHWEMTELDVQMNGKALFFKTISVREKQIDSDFRSLPGQTTLKQAEELLAINSGS